MFVYVVIKNKVSVGKFWEGGVLMYVSLEKF